MATVTPLSLEPIVNKAIPISFPGVKCALMVANETQKAIRRREQLTADILTLLENQANAGNRDSLRVDGNNY